MKFAKHRLRVGTLNRAKLTSVENVFGDLYHITGCEAPSHVSAQPMSDEETRQGAINRAKYASLQQKTELAIGLEGGVMHVADHVFICNWGALVTDSGDVFTAAGARIPLPEELTIELNKGKELGDVIDDYAMKRHVRQYEGAIGILTNGTVTRSGMFTHINLLLKGQYERSQHL